jgi:predicted TIM-barrel fold metal-dependent hydrolase
VLYDADSHFAPTEIYKKFDPELVERVFSHCHPMDLDLPWAEQYNKIKKEDWPICDRLVDFYKLPSSIKQTIKDTHNITGLYISTDLNEIYYDPPENEFPTIEGHQKSAKLLLEVDRQVLNPNTQGLFNPLNYHLDSSIVREYTKNWNDGTLELCEEKRNFDTTFFLSLQDIEGSQQEFERCCSRGYFAVRLIDHFPWGFMDQFEWLWKACAQHKIPVYLHLGGHFEPAPLTWKWNYWNPRYQTMLKQWQLPRFGIRGDSWITGIVSFITEGVLDRHPDLRIISCEHGLGWIPKMRKFMREQGWPDPLPYFKKNFWFTTEVEEDNFVWLGRSLGWNRLLYSSDYPHNDAGGNNRYKDGQDLKSLIENKHLTQQEFDQFTHQNYLKLKERSD